MLDDNGANLTGRLDAGPFDASNNCRFSRDSDYRTDADDVGDLVRLLQGKKRNVLCSRNIVLLFSI